jgi:hypothetical protein
MPEPRHTRPPCRPADAPSAIAVARSCIDEDPRLQRVTWRLQRIGWAGMLLVVIAALGGVFGAGPMAHGTAATADGALILRFDRVARVSRDADWLVTLPAGRSDIAFEAAALEAFRLGRFEPRPIHERQSGDHLTFAFASSGADRLVLRLVVTARAPGRKVVRLRAGDHELAVVVRVLP